MSQSRFKVGTFNLYNLVLPERNFYGRRQYSPVEYLQKKKWIKDQLFRMNADIIGFQEIFHKEALQQILNETNIYDDTTLLVGEESGDSPVVGLATRFKVLDHQFIKNFPQEAQIEFEGTPFPIRRFSRPVLRATLEIRPELKVVVFVVHLKSKNPLISHDEDRHNPVTQAIGKAKSLLLRAAEATALRCLLVDTLRGNDKSVILMGDINDSGGAVTSEIMSGSPPWRNLPFEKKRRIWDMLLYNVKDIQARQSYRDVYYSHIHNGHYESLDHILVSQEFVRENPNHLGYVEYVTVYNDHLIDETLSEENVESWQSDHGQVVTSIKLR